MYKNAIHEADKDLREWVFARLMPHITDMASAITHMNNEWWEDAGYAVDEEQNQEKWKRESEARLQAKLREDYCKTVPIEYQRFVESTGISAEFCLDVDVDQSPPF